MSIHCLANGYCDYHDRSDHSSHPSSGVDHHFGPHSNALACHSGYHCDDHHLFNHDDCHHDHSMGSNHDSNHCYSFCCYPHLNDKSYSDRAHCDHSAPNLHS